MFSQLKKKLGWSGRILFMILIAALLARIIYALRPAIPWWDETIYIGMAKWIFSGGTLGYWESFRPVVMPFLLGFGWKAGFSVIVWGKILQIIASLGIIVLTYLIGEKMYKNAGVIAASMMAFLPVFFSYSNKLLTGIPATFFLLLALWLVYQKKWYWIGFFLGLAFMTRFVLAFGALAIAIGVLLPWITAQKKTILKKKTLEELFSKVAKLLVGFFTLVVPYLISNLILYSDAFYPIKEGSRVFTQYNNWLYEGGRLFYTNVVLGQNTLLIFCILGIVAFIRLKMWKSEVWTFALSTMILFMGYFGFIPHKEARFFIPIFPLIAIFAGVGIAWMLFMAHKKWKKPSQQGIRIIVTLIAIFSLLTSALALTYAVPEASLAGDKEDYYNYFNDGSQSDDLFIASGPLYMVYTDKPITFLRSWELAEEVWSRYGASASHVAIDLCDHPCEEGSECETWRADFLENMDSRGSKVLDGVYENWDDQICELFIWEIN